MKSPADFLLGFIVKSVNFLTTPAIKNNIHNAGKKIEALTAGSVKIGWRSSLPGVVEKLKNTSRFQ
jgi:hypothetical protein